MSEYAIDLKVNVKYSLLSFRKVDLFFHMNTDSSKPKPMQFKLYSITFSHALLTKATYT